MRPLHLVWILAAALCCGCSSNQNSTDDAAAGFDATLTWDVWSKSMLQGKFNKELPPIPSSGWTQKSDHSWKRDGAEIADRNSDGFIDYLRIVDPPFSYNHHIWVDSNFDGYFNDDVGLKNENSLAIPDFALARQGKGAKLAQKPNVIIIFIDDQGYQDLGVYGSPNIKTPHIDKMAKEGMRFTDFYSASPVCTPSRAALLTGCYPQRVGGLNVLFPDDTQGLSSDETTIAEMLKANGYATACIGKWHLGHHQEFLPTQHGFDSYFGIPYSNDMSIAKDMKLSADLILREGVTTDSIWEAKKNWVPLMRNEEVIEYPANQNTLSKRYTEEALKFINQNHDQPFFLYLPHTMPHIPLYASADFEGKSELGLYGDCIEEIDWSVGQIMQTLKKLKLEEKTIVFYTSDNGPWDLKGNATDKVKGNKNRRIGGSALPLRGFKFQAWEGGMRVPALAWWPGQIPANTTCVEVAGTIDILPTLATLSAGASLPELEIDGKSIAPLLLGFDNATSPHAAYFYRDEAVRVGPWKGRIHPKSKEFELYNLRDDIAESKNLAADHPERAKSMLQLLKAHCKEMEQNQRPCGEVEVAK